MCNSTVAQQKANKNNTERREMEPQKIPTTGEENENTRCEAEALTEGKMTLKLKQFKLNIGGTRYEVSNSLLDQFQDSMLRRITSDTWNNESNDPLLDPDLTKKEQGNLYRKGWRKIQVCLRLYERWRSFPSVVYSSSTTCE